MNEAQARRKACVKDERRPGYEIYEGDECYGSGPRGVAIRVGEGIYRVYPWHQVLWLEGISPQRDQFMSVE
jgi:hypothetical protein